MEKVGLSRFFVNRYPHEFSGGQRQRIGVARALALNPKLILADEPTGNLDTANGEEVLELLNQLNGDGTTVIMVTHDPSHADHAARVVHMLDGRVLSENIIGLTDPVTVTIAQAPGDGMAVVNGSPGDPPTLRAVRRRRSAPPAWWQDGGRSTDER